MDPCQFAEYLEPVFDEYVRPPRPCNELPWLSLELLEELVQREHVLRIRNDHERLDLIEAKLRRTGIREPLILVIDDRGMVVLRDGHHRVLVSRRVGLAAWPVVFERSERIRTRATPIAHVLEQMLVDVRE